jgi:hypothetical protein
MTPFGAVRANFLPSKMNSDADALRAERAAAINWEVESSEMNDGTQLGLLIVMICVIYPVPETMKGTIPFK